LNCCTFTQAFASQLVRHGNNLRAKQLVISLKILGIHRGNAQEIRGRAAQPDAALVLSIGPAGTATAQTVAADPTAASVIGTLTGATGTVTGAFDVHAVGQFARVVTMIQIAFDPVVIGAFATVASCRVQVLLAPRSTDPGTAGG
jgi:hypothetical protein